MNSEIGGASLIQDSKPWVPAGYIEIESHKEVGERKEEMVKKMTIGSLIIIRDMEEKKVAGKREQENQRRVRLPIKSSHSTL